MDERKRNIWRNSTIIGIVVIFVLFIIVNFFELNIVTSLMRILCTVLALIAFEIRLIIEIAGKERCDFSIFMVIVCFIEMLLNAVLLGAILF